MRTALRDTLAIVSEWGHRKPPPATPVHPLTRIQMIVGIGL